MNWTLLLAAMVQVESGGDFAAINEKEQAYGLLQIRECVVEDVNHIYGNHFKHSRYYLSKKEYSYSIAKKYLTYWGAKREGKTGLATTPEVYARIWNGGPNGASKKSTLNYWIKVEAEMKRLEQTDYEKR